MAVITCIVEAASRDWVSGAASAESKGSGSAVAKAASVTAWAAGREAEFETEDARRVEGDSGSSEGSCFRLLRSNMTPASPTSVVGATAEAVVTAADTAE